MMRRRESIRVNMRKRIFNRRKAQDKKNLNFFYEELKSCFLLTMKSSIISEDGNANKIRYIKTTIIVAGES